MAAAKAASKAAVSAAIAAADAAREEEGTASANPAIWSEGSEGEDDGEGLQDSEGGGSRPSSAPPSASRGEAEATASSSRSTRARGAPGVYSSMMSGGATKGPGGPKLLPQGDDAQGEPAKASGRQAAASSQSRAAGSSSNPSLNPRFQEPQHLMVTLDILYRSYRYACSLLMKNNLPIPSLPPHFWERFPFPAFVNDDVPPVAPPATDDPAAFPPAVRTLFGDATHAGMRSASRHAGALSSASSSSSPATGRSRLGYSASPSFEREEGDHLAGVKRPRSPGAAAAAGMGSGGYGSAGRSDFAFPRPQQAGFHVSPGLEAEDWGKGDEGDEGDEGEGGYGDAEELQQGPPPKLRRVDHTASASSDEEGRELDADEEALAAEAALGSLLGRGAAGGSSEGGTGAGSSGGYADDAATALLMVAAELSQGANTQPAATE